MCTKWCPRCHIQAIVLSGVLRVITNPQRYSQRTVCPTEFQLTQASGAIPVLKALVEKYHKSEISYLFDRYFVIIVKIFEYVLWPKAAFSEVKVWSHASKAFTNLNGSNGVCTKSSANCKYSKCSEWSWQCGFYSLGKLYSWSLSCYSKQTLATCAISATLSGLRYKQPLP